MKWPIKSSDQQTLGEEIANTISHGLMIPLGIFILVFFSIEASKQRTLATNFIVLIFSISMIILYLMSTLFHALAFTKAQKFFQKTDHISIYLLIWGTFAPILLLLKELQEPFFNLSITKGQFFFISQCILVLCGILGKIFWFNKGKNLHIVFYVLLGWSGLLFFPKLMEPHNKRILLFIFLGGVFYSLGVFFYVKDNKKYFHFIWHIFVMLGTLFHVLGIYFLLKNLN
ncbi:PAQR family membrane homeostasis protein TrhA ['Fragaria x ananassa' phyllody phytoplasma]|nr:hemolysin III family protein ['Fragaria x ananassa' phyllody phytoplasma]